jgi:hypoxanthine phosphoribosyltransferase
LEYLRLSWREVEVACSKISREISSRDIAEHLLVGISRGGLVPLRLISDNIAAQEVSTLAVRFYENIGKTADVPRVFFPVQGDVSGKDIILVDDISDTGKSLIAAKEHLKNKGAEDIVIVTICMKPHTHIVPDIYEIETSDWVIFPWEIQETARHIVQSAEDREDATMELNKASITEDEYVEILNQAFGDD